ncbi:MAG: 30S ribosomal protein S15 [Deltaproteobacteria bacterium]
MPLEKEEKSQIIADHRIHDNDVGSPQVQIAVLTHRIEELSKHIRTSPNDLSSKRGLLALISKRRTLLGYFRGEEPEKYADLLKKLGLRK